MAMNRGDWIDSLSDDTLEMLSEEQAGTLSLVEGLNDNQIKAVTTIEGPVQINAVAGAGKTAVLTRRIAYMRSRGVKPTEILCTTFTKKATLEMRERLEPMIPSGYLSLMTLGTTHSIAFHILKQEYKALNDPRHIALSPGKDLLMNSAQKVFMEILKKDLIKDMNIPFEVKEELTDIAAPQFIKAFGLAKNDNIGPLEYEEQHGHKNNTRMDAYVLFYKKYEERKARENVLDGDDLLFLLVRLFQEHPDILAKYQRKYKYLLVDEAQDNNNLQYMLVRMLAYPQNNVFLVGDDDQSMYSFRGAKPQEFIDFRKNFRGTKMIPLEYNYRSAIGILNSANKLIANNSNRIVKQLRTIKEDDGKHAVMFSHYEDETAEAKAVVADIKNAVEVEGKYEHKGVFVMYRTNAQSRAFEDQLILSGMPYVIHGGISFYERAEVKDLVSYLRLVVDPHDEDAFERIYNKPLRYLGKAFLAKASKWKGSYWDTINDRAFYKTLKYEKNGVDSIINLITKLRDLHMVGDTPEELLDVILKDGYEEYITKDEEEEEDNSRMENISTLKYVIQQFKDLGEFLDYIHLMTTTAKHDINGVQLLTVHKSKGLECDCVYGVGLNEGILPHFRAVQEFEEGTRPEAIQEERRLGYVLVTRARYECYLSAVSYFNGRPSKVSRFIKEMGNTVLYLDQEYKTDDDYEYLGQGVLEIDDLVNDGPMIRAEYEEMVCEDARVNGPRYAAQQGAFEGYMEERFKEHMRNEARREIRELNEILRDDD